VSGGGEAAVVCLGNRFRGDDAAGLLVGDRLRRAGVPVTECADEPTRLIDGWDGVGTLVLVDAARSGADPGTVRRIELGRAGIPRELGLTSSHAFGIGETLELARELGRLPGRVVVYAVEAGTLAAGAPLTPAVAAALDGVAAAVRAEVGR
jgi:hydrogenase maturation protease